MLIRDITLPPRALEDITQNLWSDLVVVRLLANTRYLHPRLPVLKGGNLSLLWFYAEDKHTHHRFVHMLRVTPDTFRFILSLIKDDSVFIAHSQRPQAPVDHQLAVMLYRLGHYGNAASIEGVATWAGISEGSVEAYTRRCIIAINRHQTRFVCKPTTEEIEVEKRWVEKQVGCPGWRDGWLMYDGTIVVLYQKPGLEGDAYYTRKANYGLNVQVRHPFIILVLTESYKIGWEYPFQSPYC